MPMQEQIKCMHAHAPMIAGATLDRGVACLTAPLWPAVWPWGRGVAQGLRQLRGT